jgi:uncharacterized protein YndB with AHSA1/START domain
MSTDRIEKHTELRAPVSRVWRALTNHEEFGRWFGAKLETPFSSGTAVRGRITHLGYEHITMELVVQRIEPERLFSFTWHPNAVDPSVDYSKETPTLVEFRLEEIPGGTRLTITESGFDALPSARRDEARRQNAQGWEFQLGSIARHVGAAS